MARTKTTERQIVLLDAGQKAIHPEDVIELLQSEGGPSVDQLAETYGVSGSHLRQYLRRNGFQPVRQPTIWKQVAE